MRKKTNGVSALWRTIAVGVMAYQADLALALPMLGPVGLNGHSTVNLAQSNANQVISTQSIPSQQSTLAQEYTVTETVVEDPCHTSLNTIFDDTLLQTGPADALINFVENYCTEAADIFLPKIATPYFCFYSGTVLTGKLKETITKQSGEKPQIIADYCTAMETQVFSARVNLIDQVLHGEPCIDQYDINYGGKPLAVEFDPISREITPRKMCAEFITMINTLLESNKATLPNSTRYSYLISQQVDLETQQVDTYSGCIKQQAEADPGQACINIVTQPGYFDLYSQQDKADACQVAIATWADLKASDASADVCAILTSHAFQSYSWYLQDLSDAIIGELTVRLTEQLAATSAEFQQQSNEQSVSLFLSEQTDASVVQEGQDLVNDIYQTEYENQLLANQQNSAAVAQQLTNIANVQSALPDLLSIASQPQVTAEQVATDAANQQAISDVQTMLNDVTSLAQTQGQAVMQFLEGVQPTAAEQNQALLAQLAAQQPVVQQQAAQVQTQLQQPVMAQTQVQPQQQPVVYAQQEQQPLPQIQYAQVQQAPQQQQQFQQQLPQTQSTQQQDLATLQQLLAQLLAQPQQQQQQQFAQQATAVQQQPQMLPQQQFAQTQVFNPMLAPQAQQQPMMMAQQQVMPMQQQPQQFAQAGVAVPMQQMQQQQPLQYYTTALPQTQVGMQMAQVQSTNQLGGWGYQQPAPGGYY